MGEPRYTVEYDSRLGLYRWQIQPGERLMAGAPSPARAAPRIVALGGGTGLPVLLEGLRAALFPPSRAWEPARDGDRLTAVVTVADDGGSSGRLRHAYHVLPPGDIRNCLLALSDGDPTLASIFNFRFDGAGEVAGHSLGNLILTALSRLERDFLEAVERGGQILAIRGRVFPSTLEDVTLRAEFADGSSVEGESQIPAVRRAIRRVALRPEGAHALPQARQAVEAADLIVIGPGSLYTSLIATLLLRDLAHDIARSRARVVLVMNLMTERGETDGYTAADHLQALRRHAPEVHVTDVLLNTAPIPPASIDYYAAEGAAPVPPDAKLLQAMGCQPVERDLLSPGPLVRHDPHKLAQAVLALAAEGAR